MRNPIWITPRTPRRPAMGPGTRLRAIDAARGLAMMFVCLSHFGLEYFRRLDEPAIAGALYMVGMVGSPTFMLISGIMVGVLYETKRSRFAKHRMLLADRALFMLTAGHVLIMAASGRRPDSLMETLQRGFITDVLAVALLLGPWLVWRVSQRARLLMAAVLFAGGWLLALQWAPHHAFDKVLRYLLVGSYPGDVPHNFPLLHWLGVFIAASVLGQWMGERLATGRQRSVERALLLAGGSAVSSVVLYKVGQWTLAMQSGPLVAVLGSPWRKLPPSPAYLLFYGGLALLLLATALIVERRRFAKAAFAWASLVGRTSFFVFIVQFYVYYVLLLSLNLPYTPFWPLLFVASLAGITLLAKVWDDGAMNRHLSVGLRQFSATRMGRLLMASVRTRPRLGRAASTLRGDIA